MKHSLKSLLLFSLLVLATNSEAMPTSVTLIASLPAAATIEKPLSLLPGDKTPDLSRLSRKEFEKITGRKMTMKEKVAFRYYKILNSNPLNTKKGKSSPGKTAFVLGIISCSLLVVSFFFFYALLAAIPLAIIAIIKGSKASKENPDDKKARTGMILGWVSLGLAIVWTILAVIAIATFFGI
jgi:hypothetical protein